MIKHLKKSGDSLALIFDQPILDATKINPSTALEITVEGDSIVLKPVRNALENTGSEAGGKPPSGQSQLDRAHRLRDRIRRRRGGRSLPLPEDMIAESRQLRDEELTGLS